MSAAGDLMRWVANSKSERLSPAERQMYADMANEAFAKLAPAPRPGSREWAIQMMNAANVKGT